MSRCTIRPRGPDPVTLRRSTPFSSAILRANGDANTRPCPLPFACAAGFAAGTLVGMTLERWIASGHVLVRVISDIGKEKLVGDVRGAGFGVTVLSGEGREGEQEVLFIVALRRRAQELLDLIRKVDDHAFVTIDPVQKAMGGYLPAEAAMTGLRK